jgi:hypothetical protein
MMNFVVILVGKGGTREDEGKKKEKWCSLLRGVLYLQEGTTQVRNTQDCTTKILYTVEIITHNTCISLNKLPGVVVCHTPVHLLPVYYTVVCQYVVRSTRSTWVCHVSHVTPNLQYPGTR